MSIAEWFRTLEFGSLFRNQLLNVGQQEIERAREAELRFCHLTETNFRAQRVALDIDDPYSLLGYIAAAVFQINGFHLHDVQLIAILNANRNVIIEMQTGEGKTLVTGAIAAKLAMQGAKVHVGTSNAYLAERDSTTMAPVLERLGLSHGLLVPNSSETQSRRSYRKEVVYGPGYQFGFDYLRDQMFLRNESRQKLGFSMLQKIGQGRIREQLIQDGRFEVAIIDEADSVMIDEALTPLIISLPSENNDSPIPYGIAERIVARMERDRDYSVDEVTKKLEVTDLAMANAHQEIALERTIQLSRPWRKYIENAIRAKELFQNNVHYVVKDEKVQIVDQFTGRIFEDRTWQAGLHQAVEAKEKVTIQPGRESTATVSRQRYLKMYENVIGLTGTAKSAEHEFRTVYGCRTTVVETNKPCIREVLTPRFFVDQELKLKAIAEAVGQRHSLGQPILIGTRTIKESLEVAAALDNSNLEYVMLNGIQNEEEALIIAEAGQWGAITIATNMAGRGTDIKIAEECLRVGGLHVIGVSFNESQRIDRQLAGRAARQGQPGSVQFFCSAEDELLVENKSEISRTIRQRAGKNGESPNLSRQVFQFQSMLEARKLKQRTDMMLRDRWMDSVRESIENK